MEDNEHEKRKMKPQTKRTHRWAFPLGLGIGILAIIGAITLISFGINSIKQVTNKTALKKEYAVFIKNVVRNDPSPYDDISKANMSELLDAAIWDLIGTGNTAVGKYEYSENDPIGFRIPQDDIEFHFVRLFGSEVKPQHDAVLGAGYTFFYDAVAKEYTIPVTGISPIYAPEVYAIDKKGSSIILTVGFVGYGEWDTDELGWHTDPEPVKFMKITLRERKTDNPDIPPYYVGALQATEAEDIAVSTAKKSETTQTPPTTQAETEQTDQTAETDDTGETVETGDTDNSTSTDETGETSESTDE
ncbi:MAG TPA: hypothetical protein VFD23_02280 [Clostridia bacterium]|nr:hypothetical protein [Clostridia bacterium]